MTKEAVPPLGPRTEISAGDSDDSDIPVIDSHADARYDDADDTSEDMPELARLDPPLLAPLVYAEQPLQILTFRQTKLKTTNTQK